MKHVITNAAEITVLEVIDNTFKTGGGPVSVGGCVVVASKGPVGLVTQVSDDTWEDSFGKPLPKKSYGMEGLRHLSEAAKKCNYVNVVRVVAADAKFPSLYYATADGGVTKSEHAYGTTLTLGVADMMLFHPADGDPSVNRRVVIKNVDSTTKRFDIVLLDKNNLGEDYTLLSLTVGVDSDDTDDMGRPAYIETVVEQQGKGLLACDFNEALTWADIESVLQAIEDDETSFAGGTNGGDPTVDNWKNAAALLADERVSLNLLFAAGCYEPDVLQEMAEIADDRHCSFFCDAPPYLPHAQAITWLKDAGIKSRHTRMYYSPFSASDPWRGGQTIWSASGAAAAAKARCNAIFSGGTPGVHYSPAGAKRGVLVRTGVKPLFPDDRLNRDDLVDARINPVIPLSSGGVVIDDDLTLHYKQNYSRFGIVNDILDYIDHRFLEAASYAKFEPDGLTREILFSLTSEIMKDLVTSGALVPPRNPTEDGTEPYVITIKQEEIDLWLVGWAICSTGLARRIAGQPRLIK